MVGGESYVSPLSLSLSLSLSLIHTHTHSLLFLSLPPLQKRKQCLVSYTAGAADAAKLASKRGRSGGEANAPAANCASAAAAAAAAPLDVADADADADDDAGRRRRRHPAPPAAAETTPAPPPRRVEWEENDDDDELETPLTQLQQQQRSRKRNRSSESAVACFFLDLFSWRDPPLSLLALAAASAALFFSLSSSSPLTAWAASSAPLLSHLASALFDKSLLTLLCHLALFDLGVNSLRSLISEKLRERGDLSGSVVEAAAATAAASMVRCLCSLRDAVLNPRDPKAALRTALLLAAGSCLLGSGGGGKSSSVVTVGFLKEVLNVAAVSGFYLGFAAGAAWRWWPRKKERSSSSSSSSSLSSSRRSPRPILRPDDLSAAASLAARKLSASISFAARKTGLAAMAEVFASLVALSLGTRVALGSLAAAVAWRLSAWSARGAALLLLLLFARAHVFGEKASREMTRRAMRHPVMASARKGCAALGSAARERVTMRRRRRREAEEEAEAFFEEEEEGDGGRGRGLGAGTSDLYSSRLQEAANDALQQHQQQKQQHFRHSSRPAAFRRGGAIQ